MEPFMEPFMSPQHPAGNRFVLDYSLPPYDLSIGS